MPPAAEPAREAVAPPGVSRSCVVPPDGPWPSLLDFLADRFRHISRDTWAARLGRGEVTDEAGKALTPDAPFMPHRRYFYYRQPPTEARIPFDEAVLYQDELIVVADKPHFLPVTPSGRYLQETLLVRLKRRLGIETLAPVHRIDRDTAGLVLFSVQPATRGRYQGIFRDRLAEKHYEAVATWRADLPLPHVHASRLEEGDSFMTLREVPGEANSHTRIALLKRLPNDLALYDLQPLTGKRHQLRVHMTALGMPIVNDQMYPVLEPEREEPDYSRPLQLLARRLAFTDPVSGALRRFESRHRLAHADGAGGLP